MPAVIRFPPGCRHGGSIRIGPRCHGWHTPYEHLLAFEVDGDAAVIGGLNWPLSREEYIEIVMAIAAVGLQPAMERAKPGRAPYRVLLAVPNCRRRTRPAPPNGPTPRGETMSHRKPKHPSHAGTSTPEGAAATSAEIRHSADLVDAGKLHIKDGSGTVSEPDEDGYETVSFKRKLDPSLTD